MMLENIDVETWMHASVKHLKIVISAVLFVIFSGLIFGTAWQSEKWNRLPNEGNSLCRECAVPKRDRLAVSKMGCQKVLFLELRAVVWKRRMKAFGMDSSHVDLLRRHCDLLRRHCNYEGSDLRSQLLWWFWSKNRTADLYVCYHFAGDMDGVASFLDLETVHLNQPKTPIGESQCARNFTEPR